MRLALVYDHMLTLVTIIDIFRYNHHLPRERRSHQALRTVLLCPHIPNASLPGHLHHHRSRGHRVVHSFHISAVFYLHTLELFLG